MRLTPGIQSWFNIRNSINVIYYIIREQINKQMECRRDICQNFKSIHKTNK